MRIKIVRRGVLVVGVAVGSVASIAIGRSVEQTAGGAASWMAALACGALFSYGVVSMTYLLLPRRFGPVARGGASGEGAPSADGAQADEQTGAELAAEFAEALMGMRELLEPLNEATNALRQQFLQQGWLQPSAEQMAVAFYETQMAQLRSGMDLPSGDEDGC